jgi:hypothetical protein
MTRLSFTADENANRPVVKWLREAGHLVSDVAENLAGCPDEQMLRQSALVSHDLHEPLCSLFSTLGLAKNQL